MQTPNRTNRRDFIAVSASAAAMAAPYFVSSRSLGAAEHVAPSEKITLGVIGMGPRCTYDMKSILQLGDVQCVAIADVQQSRRDAGKKMVDDHYGNRDCQLYSDFRELLARPDIDAVIIATGDRWHAAASILAAESGKDVYSEKPCGITIGDCQNISKTFKKTGRIFQAGTQRRSVPNFQTAVQLAQTGRLGKIESLYASVYIPTLRNEWLPGEPTPTKEVCDWNMWLGPAPWRPYNSKYVAGRWRGEYDFDSGARLLDWGAHTVDLCQWANQADDTMPIQYEPTDENILCTYANGVRLVIDFLADPFGDRGPRWITRLGTCPVRFVGSEGSVETGDEGEIVASSASLNDELAQTKRVRGLDVSAHARNFFDCVKSRQQTVCNPTVMRRSHVACHAAALSWILKRKLTINPDTEAFVDDDEANRLRYRSPRVWS
ncbi:oxidoreductase domain-containing protein [Rhodopirellula maiorica SM1]|uniref:Oxidoreductase domain-containing protein n=1 Tax=Rhodopirellula maiorica SM1 TaxID=1265738 RepID=M5S4B4_9BACT|nr:Gfo/Idh/MocA family oxidoreductase [Rhodopirellula maiorica]EMI21034.1 oxidoreductase domain-containing protein [Rhodopirellula maiorica SM1]